MTKKKRTREELRIASEHLHYELLMLSAVSYAIDSGVSVLSPLHNALIESFAIHLRNLIDFLWPEGPDNDWVVAADYFSDLEEWQSSFGKIPPKLKAARIRAAKEIAHLTYARIAVEEDKKGWDFIGLLDGVADGMARFAVKVDRDKVCPELLDTG